MMLTLCPACAATFRVTSEQLKAKQGTVRCGQCQHVFNALDTLLDEAGLAIKEAPVPPPESMVAEAASSVSSNESLGEPLDELQPQTPAASDTSPPVPVESTDPIIDYVYEEIGAVGSAVSEVPAENGLSPESLPEEGETPLPDEPVDKVATPSREIEPLLHDEEPYGESQGHGRSGWWAMAALLALALLLLQVVFQFRVELAVLWPETRPALQEVCSLIGCDLPLPQKINLLGIESSELHPNPQNKGVLALTATLKNRAPFAQTYPHLELTLTDVTDQAVLRKILTPPDYLPKATDISLGFAASSDVSISLVLVPEAGIHAASAGYRLYLFYP